jgi:hypothetical protein
MIQALDWLSHLVGDEDIIEQNAFINMIGYLRTKISSNAHLKVAHFHDN